MKDNKKIQEISSKNRTQDILVIRSSAVELHQTPFSNPLSINKLHARFPSPDVYFSIWVFVECEKVNNVYHILQFQRQLAI